MSKQRSVLTWNRLKRCLVGGWPDEARYYVQSSAIRRILDNRTLYGECLNAGAGEGLYAPFLESFPRITGITNIDLSKPTIAGARPDRRHRDYAGSLTDLPFSDGHFNCCLCTEVLEHITDDEVAIGELARVLRPGADLLITVPTPPAPFDPAHVREGYTLSELSEKLNRHSLRVVKHAFCFQFFMRSLLETWRWQYENIGQKRKSYMPRALVMSFGWLDHFSRFGKPWDLVVLATRN
jgi:SAM-dependent methyltransferase